MKNAIVLCSGGLDSVTTAFLAKKLGYKITLLFFNYKQSSTNQERNALKYFANKIRTDFLEINIANLIPKNNLTSKGAVENFGSSNHNFINETKFEESEASQIKQERASELRSNSAPNKFLLSSKNLKNTKAESEKWYVPQRNLIFLSIAAGIAESLINNNSREQSRHTNKTLAPTIARSVSSGGREFCLPLTQLKCEQSSSWAGASSISPEKVDLFVGFKSEGREPFSDATEKFVNNFNKLIQKSTSGKVSLKTPLIKKDKEDIINLGKSLGIELEKTFSCYSPIKNKHCGLCLACHLRRAGFYWANEKDKTRYSPKIKSITKKLK